MSDVNSDFDENWSINSEFGSSETLSTVSSPPPKPSTTYPTFQHNVYPNIIRSLYLREIGFGKTKFNPLHSYHLKSVFPQQVLQSHVFMGMTRCGRFLITYTILMDQDDEEWYAAVYKYRLHWWTFRPAEQAKKVAEVSLFGNHKIVAPLQIFICQWPKDNEKILVYGLIKENFNVDGGAIASHQHAYVTVTALPSLDSCQDCRTVASSYLLDDIAATWDTCLRFTCLKHGYTVHSSLDIVVPYPEFIPKINLKCQDYAVFNTNNFLYSLKISLERCDSKIKEDNSVDGLFMNQTKDSPGEHEEKTPDISSDVEEDSQPMLTIHQKKVLNLKEQIIRDFSEEIHLISTSRKNEGIEDKKEIKSETNSQDSVPSSCNSLLSPPAPTRVLLDSDSSSTPHEDLKSDDCFLSPQNVKLFTKNTIKTSLDGRKLKTEARSSNDDYSQIKFKSFFSRKKLQRNSGIFLRKKMLRQNKNIKFTPEEYTSNFASCSLLTKFFSRKYSEPKSLAADSTYEFVDDSHSEVEEISLFRKKRLADKKYEFQELDSENIVPYSTVRLENTLRPVRKSMEDTLIELEDDELSVEDKLRSPSPRDLTISIGSPRSPLYLDMLGSPNQFVESVLRPLNRNTSGSNPMSPLAKYLTSPPICSRLRSPNILKQKEKQNQNVELKNDQNDLIDTRTILKHGILINDISERYLNNEGTDNETDIYKSLFKNLVKFRGRSIRFQRRFVEIDDDLVSVLTDIDDDDMSAVTGYHTALNVEVHGTGYAQLQMISNFKAEKLMAPCLLVDQQTLDIEGICHSVATTLCQVCGLTFTFCNDYDIEILDVCPRSSEVLVLLMMRIEGCEGLRDEVSVNEHYETSVTIVWSLESGDYRVCMVVPPKKVDWVTNEKFVWNPAKEAAKKFRLQLPADVTFCEPSVRVFTNASTFRGVSLNFIEDIENGVRFVL